MYPAASRTAAPGWRRGVVAALTSATVAITTVAAAPPANAGLLSTLLGVLTNTTGLVQNVLHPDGIWGDPGADATATVNGVYSPAKDPGSLYTIENAIGARTCGRDRTAPTARSPARASASPCSIPA